MLSDTEILTVIEDLEYLRDTWIGEISDAEIRRGSALLRRLLVEDIYGMAWRTAGFKAQPSVAGPNLNVLLSGQDLTKVTCALAGGGKLGGFVTGGISMHRGETIDSLKEKQGETTGGMEYLFPLSEFMETTCAVVDGKQIKRRELIKYMANTRGGVHLGSSRARAKEKQLIKKIGKLEGRINHTQKDGLFFELLSIGQAVGASEDAAKLISKYR